MPAQAGKRQFMASGGPLRPENDKSFLGLTQDLGAFVENGRWFLITPTHKQIMSCFLSALDDKVFLPPMPALFLAWCSG
jgi:hypothetical protein